MVVPEVVCPLEEVVCPLEEGTIEELLKRIEQEERAPTIAIGNTNFSLFMLYSLTRSIVAVAEEPLPEMETEKDHPKAFPELSRVPLTNCLE